MNEEKRKTIVMGYAANPTMLAYELEIMFEPCTDANYAVLHNKAVQLIVDMCGEPVDDLDAMGNKVKGSGIRELRCRDRLARSLAQTIIRHARHE